MDAGEPTFGAVERDIAEAILDLAHSFDYELGTIFGLISRMGDETNRLIFSKGLEDVEEAIFANLNFPADRRLSRPRPRSRS